MAASFFRPEDGQSHSSIPSISSGPVPCLQVRRGPSTSLGFSPCSLLVSLGLTEQSAPLHLGIQLRQLLGIVDDREVRMELPPLSPKRQIPTHARQVLFHTSEPTPPTKKREEYSGRFWVLEILKPSGIPEIWVTEREPTAPNNVR